MCHSSSYSSTSFAKQGELHNLFRDTLAPVFTPVHVYLIARPPCRPGTTIHVAHAASWPLSSHTSASSMSSNSSAFLGNNQTSVAVTRSDGQTAGAFAASLIAGIVVFAIGHCYSSSSKIASLASTSLEPTSFRKKSVRSLRTLAGGNGSSQSCLPQTRNSSKSAALMHTSSFAIFGRSLRSSYPQPASYYRSSCH